MHRLDLPTEKIIAEIKDNIGWIKFNQPEKRNAISLNMWEIIPSIIKKFSNNDEVNILSSLLAKTSGALRAVTLVNMPTYIPLVNTLGINSVISPAQITVSSPTISLISFTDLVIKFSGVHLPTHPQIL